MTEQGACMLAGQAAVAFLAAGVGRQPGVEGRVRHFATEAEVLGRHLSIGILLPALGTRPA